MVGRFPRILFGSGKRGQSQSLQSISTRTVEEATSTWNTSVSELRVFLHFQFPSPGGIKVGDCREHSAKNIWSTPYASKGQQIDLADRRWMGEVMKWQMVRYRVRPFDRGTTYGNVPRPAKR